MCVIYIHIWMWFASSYTQLCVSFLEYFFLFCSVTVYRCDNWDGELSALILCRNPQMSWVQVRERMQWKKYNPLSAEQRLCQGGTKCSVQILNRYKQMSDVSAHPCAQATEDNFLNVSFDPCAVLLGVLNQAYINITLRLAISCRNIWIAYHRQLIQKSFLWCLSSQEPESFSVLKNEDEKMFIFWSF